MSVERCGQSGRPMTLASSLWGGSLGYSKVWVGGWVGECSGSKQAISSRELHHTVQIIVWGGGCR